MPNDETHVAFGTTSSLLSLCAINIINNKYNLNLPYVHDIDSGIGLFLSVTAGSISLDIDQERSTVSQYNPIVSNIIQILHVFFGGFKHRGIMHSILFPIIFMGIGIWLHSICLLYFGIGALSHKLLDGLAGIINITCGSKKESMTYIILWIINVLLFGLVLYKFTNIIKYLSNINVYLYKYSTEIICVMVVIGCILIYSAMKNRKNKNKDSNKNKNISKYKKKKK